MIGDKAGWQFVVTFLVMPKGWEVRLWHEPGDRRWGFVQVGPVIFEWQFWRVEPSNVVPLRRGAA